MSSRNRGQQEEGDGCGATDQGHVATNALHDGLSTPSLEYQGEVNATLTSSMNPSTIDDKSIVRRAYDVIDSTARRIRFSSASTKGETYQDQHISTRPDVELEMAPADPRLQPAVARATAKAASAYLSDIKGKPANHQGQKESLKPGAEYVRARAPGLSAAFYARITRRERQGVQGTPPLDLETRDSTASPTFAALEGAITTSCVLRSNDFDEGKRIGLNMTNRTLWTLAVVISVLVAAAVGITLGIQRDDRQTNTQNTGPEEPTRFGRLATNCSFVNGEQPNVFSQCSCTGNISFVVPDIEERYNILKRTFIGTVLPDFNESLPSCDPQNQALLWLASGDGTTTESRMRQRYTLALLFAAWNGTNWSSKNRWLSSHDECTWYGLQCNDQDMVTNITVAQNNAVVDLAPVAGLLNRVKSLHASYSSLQGSTVPPEVGLLTSLEVLDLSWSGIRGTLPKELFNLGETLQYFEASSNSLSGTIPTLIGKLARLKYWYMSEEIHLTGTIPSELGRCTNLEDFFVDANKLNGTIPSEIGSISTLRNFGLRDNDFTGTLPTELGCCTQLTVLDFRSNHFYGTVPAELASAPLSDGLLVTFNHLEVPKVICDKFAKTPSKCEGCNC